MPLKWYWKLETDWADIVTWNTLTARGTVTHPAGAYGKWMKTTRATWTNYYTSSNAAHRPVTTLPMTIMCLIIPANNLPWSWADYNLFNYGWSPLAGGIDPYMYITRNSGGDAGKLQAWFYGWWSGGNAKSVTASWTAGKKYFVAWVIGSINGANELRVFVQWNREWVATGWGGAFTPQTNTYIGGNAYNEEVSMDWVTDEVRVYNEICSDAFIKTMHAFYQGIF